VKGAVTLLLLLLPSLVSAEGTSSPDFSFLSSFIQMIAALSIVVGLILLTKHFSARLMSGNAGRPASKHIRVIETRYLNPKKSLILVEVGGQYLLLASSDEGISFLKQVELLEEIEVVEEGRTLRSGLAGLFGRKEGMRND
jgi:flagellar protein FliO/FliZ